MTITEQFTRTRPAEWQSVIEMTAEMQVLAQQEDWLAVAELETRRQQAIQQFFAQAISPEDQAQIRADIQDILRLDSELLQAGQAAREDISRQLTRMANSRQAHKAYSSNTGNP